VGGSLAPVIDLPLEGLPDGVCRQISGAARGEDVSGP
jgi:hypothetical protein